MNKKWIAYLDKDIASVDTKIFGNCVKQFVVMARVEMPENEWLVCLYGALQWHFSIEFIRLLLDCKIVAVTLPAHTSDRI